MPATVPPAATLLAAAPVRRALHAQTPDAAAPRRDRAPTAEAGPIVTDIQTIDPETFHAIAVRLPEGRAPKIDGRLDDDVWALAPAQGRFIQREPRFGWASTERTEFRILYDAKTLYFGIWAFDDDPDGDPGERDEARLAAQEGRLDQDHDRHLPRPPQRVLLQHQPPRRAQGREHRRGGPDDQLRLERGLAGADEHRRARLVRRDRDPPQPAAVQGRAGRDRLGTQPLPDHRPQERGDLLGALPAGVAGDRLRPHVARRRPARPARPLAAAQAGAPAVRGAQGPPRLRRGHADPGRRGLRLRSEGGPDVEPQRRPDLQDRLRAGRGRPGGGQPLALLAVLPREAPVLHRERRHLRLRQQRRQRRQQPRAAAALLQPPHRPPRRPRGADHRRGPRDRPRGRLHDRDDEHRDRARPPSRRAAPTCRSIAPTTPCCA